MHSLTASIAAKYRQIHRPDIWHARAFIWLMMVIMGITSTIQATVYVNANNSSYSLNNTNDWQLGGVTPATLPGVNDTILFTGSTVTSPLGGNLSVSNLTMDTGATTSMRIGSTAGATLTIGAGGITKTYSGNKMELSCNLALSANQTWTNAGNNIQVDSSAAWTFNGYTLTLTGGGTFDNRCTVNFGTNVNIRCSVADFNLAGGDFNLGSGSNSFTTFTVYSGTVEGSTFPVDTASTTSSSFGNASSGTITLGSTNAFSTLIYNGNTVATPKTITMDARSSNVTINVSSPGQTLTLTNLLYSSGTLQPANRSWNIGGAGNLTIAGNITNSGSTTYTIGITKNDAGTLTLLGTNTYAGATTVTNGTLLVNGSIASPVTVFTGGILGGSGTISNNVILQSGAVATNTVGAPLTVTGALVLNNNTLYLNTTSALASGNYPLLTYNITGSSGSFNSTPVISGNGLVSGATSTVVTSGGTVSLVVVPPPTTTLLTSSANPVIYGQSVSLTATVQTNGVTTGDATGTVTFFDGSSPISGAVTLTSGQAQFATSGLTAGIHSLTAVYSGDPNYASSTNAPALSQTVVQQLTYIKAANTNALNDTNSWLVDGITPITLPGPYDFILVSNITSGLTAPLGDDLSIYAFILDPSTTGSFRISRCSLRKSFSFSCAVDQTDVFKLWRIVLPLILTFPK